MKNNSQQPYSKPKSHPVLNLSSKAIGELVKEFMQKGKNLKFKTKGDSMRPMIKDGDIITVSPYVQRSPDSGDVVAYLHPLTKGLIVHRIIKISKKSFIAKGDSCRNNDTIHETTCIMGYVSQINEQVSMINTWLLPPLKKILVFLSRIRLLFIFNKFLQRI